MSYDEKRCRAEISSFRANGLTLLADVFEEAVDEAERLRATLACERRHREINEWFSCDCTNMSACERHAFEKAYAKCSICGLYEIPLEEAKAPKGSWNPDGTHTLSR
jgi:hypothetical protein